ncbi:MAG TPA: hypothetical protein VEC11_07010 [Allosphingosinicella sp.]|nr:hypothetical protein [Allosphingosinicella sp.]
MRVPRAQVPFLLLLLAATPAAAQQIVTSARPDRVEVTVYRAPHRPANEPFELEWLRGYALISETRRITLPAGESEIRFEGVAGGILPQSAIVRGFPQGIVERNRDALLLSPDSLLDRSLGRRVHLRRTSRATGAVREQDAVVRSGADGAVVLQTAEGFEALRCTGQAETLTYDSVPAGLSARPTLSVRARSSAPVTATVTLAYLADGFDWQANYIATLAPDGRHVELFAWLTLANGDETGFANADTQAVAGRLNRETGDDDDRRPGIRRVEIDEDGEAWFDDDGESDAHELRLQCWPQGTTSSLPALPAVPTEEIRLQGRFRLGAVRAGMIGGNDEDSAIVVTGTRAVQEELGDLKLYRIPEPVTVAARSQKQVAFLQQPRVRVDTVYRVRMEASYDEESDTARRILVTRNRTAEGLGVPLPGGTLQLFARRAGGPILLGEGGVRDHAVGEDVEISLDDAPGIATALVEEEREDLPDNVEAFRVTVTNDRPEPIRYELELQLDEDEQLRPQGARLARRNGMPLWRVTVPANGSATLRYRIIEQQDES